MNHPKTAYILLWFPKPSETFIFREVRNLEKMGLPLEVFSLYGRWTGDLSPEMTSVSAKVERLGLPLLRNLRGDFLYWWRRDRRGVKALLRKVLVRRWRGLEKTGESLWAFLSAFRLARRFEERGIEHIHAPWASGPATAAWIASRLTGIPFTFTARAWDIYPPDSLLEDKMRDAKLVRSETRTNIRYLTKLAPRESEKIRLTYNGVVGPDRKSARLTFTPPYKLLALGRFVEKKGYAYLIKACKILRDSDFPFLLTLAGDGSGRGRLERLARRSDLDHQISFLGFVSHDRVPHLFREADVFIMPSIVARSGDRDGIPTVVIEALDHGVPVVASDVSGISEVIEDGETGFLVPEKNPDAIARAIARVCRDRDQAIETANRGRERVRRQFGQEPCHTTVLRLYDELFQ